MPVDRVVPSRWPRRVARAPSGWSSPAPTPTARSGCGRSSTPAASRSRRIPPCAPLLDACPAAPSRRGCVDFVLRPEQIAQRAGAPGAAPVPALDRAAGARDGEASRSDGSQQDEGEPAADPVAGCARRHGVDFSQYKRSTLRRRLARRMAFKTDRRRWRSTRADRGRPLRSGEALPGFPDSGDLILPRSGGLRSAGAAHRSGAL